MSAAGDPSLRPSARPAHGVDGHGGQVGHDGHDGADGPGRAGPPVHPVCPNPVRWPTQLHRWEQLTFLHWAYEPAAVQALLPDGLEVETWNGLAWVALVPFHMTAYLPGGPPPAPWLSYFPETNVRTYVTAPDGTTGVWFLSLDASRLAAVVAARAGFRLPYYWSKMTVVQTGPVLTYRSRRWWPGPRGASVSAAVEVGDRFAPHELGPFDHWLTGRWRLFADAGRGRLRYALADHPPWVLHRARLLHLEHDLFRAAGLPDPLTDEPVVHHAPGVPVRISLPHAVR